jgi:hypothetical protein
MIRFHEMHMIKFHHEFNLVPKLSLRGQLEGLNIIKKHNVLISASWQKELYLNIVYPFFQVLHKLHALIEDALIQ